MVVNLVLNRNLEGVQYILRFKVLKDYENKKIVLCQAYNQVSFKNEGLCAYAPKCWDSLGGDMMVDNIPSVENLLDRFTKKLTRRVFVGHRDNIGF